LIDWLVDNNYGAMLYRLRDIASYWSKITKILYPLVFNVLGISRRCLILIKKNDWATVWWKTITISYAVMDERADGRTDKIAISLSRVSMLTRD